MGVCCTQTTVSLRKVHWYGTEVCSSQIKMKGMRSRASSLVENIHFDKRNSVEDVKAKLASINNSTLFKPKKERKVVPFELVDDIQL